MRQKKLALLHEFDDNVAVVATNVAITSSGIVQLQAKKPPRRSLVQLGVRFTCRRRVRGTSGGSGRGSSSSRCHPAKGSARKCDRSLDQPGACCVTCIYADECHIQHAPGRSNEGSARKCGRSKVASCLGANWGRLKVLI